MVQFGMWAIWRQRATATKMADIPVITSPFSPHEYAWPSIIETQTETHTNTQLTSLFNLRFAGLG